MSRTLFEKVFDAHTVRRLPSGQYQLLMGLHLIHEVTSPQAFSMLRERGLRVLYPERTFATVRSHHPDAQPARPFADPTGRGDARSTSSATSPSTASATSRRPRASRASCT